MNPHDIRMFTPVSRMSRAWPQRCDAPIPLVVVVPGAVSRCEIAEARRQRRAAGLRRELRHGALVEYTGEVSRPSKTPAEGNRQLNEPVIEALIEPNSQKSLQSQTICQMRLNMRIGYKVPAVLVMMLSLLPPAIAAPAKGYVMGPGDAVKITVYQNPDMQTETRISEVGSVTFPLLGPVEIGGLTPAQAEIRIAALLKSGGFVPRAQVTVYVTQFRSRQVSVLGQVTKPGRYAIEEPVLRLTDALAMAGGIAAGGAESVTVIRAGEGGEQRFEIDLLGIFDAPSQAKNIEIQNGDTLFVERIAVFYIYGEVQKPGAYRLERKMTVMQAVSLASGLTPRGSEKGLRINRRASNGSTKSVSAGMEDLILQDDVVFVKESLF